MLNRRNLPLVFLLLAVCLVYTNSFGNSFHFDDFHTVVDNPTVRSLGNLPRIVTDTTAFSVLPANQTYRPVVTASLALDYALAHGYGVFWFHLSTFLWFLLLIALLYRLAESIFDRVEKEHDHRWPALAVAAWFGLHPAAAETVNYIIQRGDVYCTLGCVAALVFYARHPALRRSGLYLMPFGLAMLSKPPAAVFPLLLLLYVYLFEARGKRPGERWRGSLLAAAPSGFVTLLLLWLQARMTPRSYTPSIVSAADYRLTQPFVWLRYAGAMFLPAHLNVDSDLQPFHTLNGAAVAGLLFLIGLLGLIVYTARRPRLYPIAYGSLWFVLTQLPTSLYTLSEVENDHRMFFSFPGLMLAAVWALHLGLEHLLAARSGQGTRRAWLPRAAAAVLGLALCGYAFGAHRRNAVWHDEASLWADDVAKSPRNGRGLMNYGLTRMNAGDFTGALELFTRALGYTPNYATLEVNLGVVNGLLADTGQPGRAADAEAHFQRAIALTPHDDLPHAYYGRWLLMHGRLPEATSQLEAAVSLDGERGLQRDLLLQAFERAGNTTAARSLAQATLVILPGDTTALAALEGTFPAETPVRQVAALINASLASYRAGQFRQSIEQAEAALKLDPRSAEAWNNVGAGYGALHEWERGIAAEEHALQLNPALAIAANNLRWFESQQARPANAGIPAAAAEAKTAGDFINLSLTLNQAGRFAESIAAARQAVALDPNSAEAWNNIAAGEEATGQWNEAIAAAQHAVALRPDFTLARNNLAWSLEQKAAGRR